MINQIDAAQQIELIQKQSLSPDVKAPSKVVEKSVSRTCISANPELTYMNNAISTSKYTWYNFIPKNLGLQFSKMANIYFLIIGCLQIIPSISISDGVPSIFLPLFFIVFITGLKDLFEDYKRKVSDETENKKKVSRFDPTLLQFQEIHWQDLRVGDIVKILKLEQFPADVLVIGTSEPKGISFIETKNLDGETNLKQKNALKEMQEYYNIPEHIKLNTIPSFCKRQISLEFEAPNVFLYQFQGACYLSSEVGKLLKERETLLNLLNKILSKNKKPDIQQLDKLEDLKKSIMLSANDKQSINNSQFILRGSSLQNTQYIYGLVTYTGHDTKIMKNSFKARSKKSQLELEMGTQIIYIFLVQMFICLFSSVYYTAWYANHKNNLIHLDIDMSSYVDNSDAYNLFVRFGNWILMFGNFVPISLLVTLEMVKFVQGQLISNDSEYMTSYANGVEIPCAVQSSNLNEELGQISYIFSDKTGTLTCNLMEFKKICINGISYGEIKKGDENYIDDISGYKEVTNVDFRDGNIMKILQSSDSERENVKKVLVMLSLCHSIITENKDGQIVYNASSPDELALVNFARYIGYEYQGLDENNDITISAMGTTQKFKLYHILEFDSTRKRNSVIIKDLQTNQYKILCKGADSIIFDRQDLQQNPKDKMDLYQNHLSEYGKIGLRTLLLAEKNLTETYFNQWNKQYLAASTLMELREESMNELQNDIETDLMIIGATAIEDKLQDQVGETIASLRQAGIKVWVLTGDKVETAINIGYSCQLISPDMKLILVEDRDQDLLSKQLKDLSVFEPYHSFGYGLVVTGDALTVIFKDSNTQLSNDMIYLASKCLSVLCCRVSPAQKQQVVSVVRVHNPDISTLAIGDGANDVSMITAAHVGIGIKGVEGQQAARASDYSIGEFKMLRPLLFIHGRESYRRNTILVLYNFFKNIILVFPQFWVSSYNNFSGQTPYDSFIYQIYNVCYTSIPIVIFAVFDDQYVKRVLFNNHENYYKIGPNRESFSSKIFWAWFTSAVLQSAVIAFFSIYSLNNMQIQSGMTYEFWDVGTSIFGMTVVVATLKIAMMQNTWNWAQVLFYIASLITYFITMVISMTITTGKLFNIVVILFSSANFHFNNILIIGGTTFIDYGGYLLFLKKTSQLDRIAPKKLVDQENKSVYYETFKVQPQVSIQPKDQEAINLKNENGSLEHGSSIQK